MSPWKQRTVGLTRNAAPLLRQVGRQPRENKRCKTPEDIHAPPEDSDAESLSDTPGDDPSTQRTKVTGTVNDKRSPSGSDTDSPPRGHIQATSFRSDKATKSTFQSRGGSRAPLVRRNSNKVAAESRGVKRGASDVDGIDDADTASDSRRKVRGPSPGSSPKESDHHTNAFNWPNVKQANRKYGKKAPKRSVFRSQDDSAPPQSSKAASFQVPVDLPPLSPVAKARNSGNSIRPGIRIPLDLPDSDTEPAAAKPKVSLNIPVDLPGEPTGKASPTGRKTRLNPSSLKSLETSSQRLDTLLSKSELKIPADLPGIGLDIDSPPSDELVEQQVQPPPDGKSESVQKSTQGHTASAKDAPARCPMCSQAVDGALLQSFTRGAHLSIDRQLKFCRLHKKKTAEATWKTKGYPTINWDTLGSRLSRHDKFIRRIVNGEDSHYRSLLAARVSKGQERTLRKTERSLAPGYYGPRGMRAMSEHLVGRFASTLRRRAVEDPIVSARGTAVFVSTVLVPELAVRLIMEDMDVDPDGARSILEASVDVGELLNEELLDTVHDPVNEDDADEADVFV